MTEMLRELYQEIIIDHNKNPRNQHKLDNATQKAKGYNPICGDQLTVYMRVDHETVVDVSFVGCGCAISQASASLMTESLKGKSLQDAETLYHQVHDLLTKEKSSFSGQNIGKLAVLSGVKAFPARVKCATLAWHTFFSALSQTQATVTTE